MPHPWRRTRSGWMGPWAAEPVGLTWKGHPAHRSAPHGHPRGLSSRPASPPLPAPQPRAHRRLPQPPRGSPCQGGCAPRPPSPQRGNKRSCRQVPSGGGGACFARSAPHASAARGRYPLAAPHLRARPPARARAPHEPLTSPTPPAWHRPARLVPRPRAPPPAPIGRAAGGAGAGGVYEGARRAGSAAALCPVGSARFSFARRRRSSR